MTPEETIVVPKQEATQLRTPWRRYFARGLDLAIYSLIWDAIHLLILGNSFTSPSLVGRLMNLIIMALLMFLFEPILLSVFGTTIGKWIWGFMIRNNYGGRLSYSKAVSRTWKMFVSGMGLNIPIYNIVRYVKSYTACNNGEDLEWEYDSVMTLRDKKGWRIGIFIIAYLAIFSASFLTINLADMPKHRGNITVEEFCENYNQFSKRYKVDTEMKLGPDGKWIVNDSFANLYNPNGELYQPEFIFTESEGIMTGLQFTTGQNNNSIWFTDYREEMLLSVMSFVHAQDGYRIISNDTDTLIKRISSTPFQEFEVTIHGVHVSWKGDPETKTYEFTMTKEKILE